jgi:anti-sigma-K factor RskA
VNVEAYISSGILEAYALGELTEQERVEVENNLAQYPQLRKELALIEETQEQLLMKGAIKPPPSVKFRLLSTIDAENPVKAKDAKPYRTDLTFWKLAAAAAITIAVISSYLAVTYWSKWRTTENSLSEIIAQNQRVAQDYNTVNERLDQIEKDLNIMNNPAFNRVVMKGTPNAPGALASIYWNENTRETYLSVQDMKELAKENQYQLWAIIDGKPVDAGVFDPNFGGLLKMKPIQPGATTFAVTIEPRGGKNSPTLETMQVVGNVVKG